MIEHDSAIEFSGIYETFSHQVAKTVLQNFQFLKEYLYKFALRYITGLIFYSPYVQEIARHLRPRSLRAQFGKDKIMNAVHCTDLPEDALLEVQYFFQILGK